MIEITSRSQWGAKPPKQPPQRFMWHQGGPLWAHHTVGNYVKPDFGDDASWLKKLAAHTKGTVKYPVNLVRKWRMLAARNAAVKKQTVEAECKAMRAIQSFHQNTRGWNDIGYHFVVFPSGRLYEGRGKNVIGAHCPGHNDEPSCSFAGDYSSKPPTRTSLVAFDDLRKSLGMRGWNGHRDGFPTSCPGDALYGALTKMFGPHRSV